MQVNGSNHHVFTDHLHNYIHLLYTQDSNDIVISVSWSSLVKYQQNATKADKNKEKCTCTLEGSWKDNL